VSQVGLASLMRRIPGYRPPLMAETVAEALAHFKTGSVQPNVVILDLDLPGEPGERLIEILRAMVDPMPVIIVTTGMCNASREAAVKALHPDAYLAKPYDRDELLAEIDKARNRGADTGTGEFSIPIV
jgi:DNA-binding response OmpR family regulator